MLRKKFDGKPVPKDTSDAILSGVGSQFGWEGRSGSTRKSEYGAVLAAYAQLPDAVAVVTASDSKAKRLYWGDVVQAARLITNADKPMSGKAAGAALIERQNKVPAPTDEAKIIARLKKQLMEISDKSDNSDKKVAIATCIAFL
jgi:hypothetical protein